MFGMKFDSRSLMLMHACLTFRFLYISLRISDQASFHILNFLNKRFIDYKGSIQDIYTLKLVHIYLFFLFPLLLQVKINMIVALCVSAYQVRIKFCKKIQALFFQFTHIVHIYHQLITYIGSLFHILFPFFKILVFGSTVHVS